MTLNQNKINLFFKLAYEQAKINLGSTSINPSVGCIIEKNGTVLSSSCTALNGRPHAETIALKKNNSLKDSNIYITLEPCSHYGLTPPCTNEIIKKKIKKVFFSILDIDKRSKNRAKKILNNKGIFTKSGFNQKYGKTFYKSYILNKKNSLPFIDSKIAISKDYFTISRNNKWITNSHSRKRAHLLRSKYDCLISTSKTINEDDSLYNCRIEGLENRSPSLVIFDRHLKIRKNLKLFNTKKKSKIILLTQTNNKSKEFFLKKKGVKIVNFNNMSTKSDLLIILFKLKDMGFTRILLESGLKLLNYFLSSKVIFNLYIFQSNIKLRKNGYNFTTNKHLKKITFNKKINVNLYGENLFKVNLK